VAGKQIFGYGHSWFIKPMWNHKRKG